MPMVGWSWSSKGSASSVSEDIVTIELNPRERRLYDRMRQWLARIENNPQIWLEMGGVRQRFEALPLRDDRSVRTSVNRAIAEKYGLADTLVGLLVDPDRSVPILIRPAAR